MILKKIQQVHFPTIHLDFFSDKQTKYFYNYIIALIYITNF